MLTEDGKHLYVSYDEYHNLIEKLAIKVHQSGWQFDTILCLARGGMRPGDILSRIFDKPLAIMSTSSYRAEAGTVQGNLDIARYITTPKGEIAGKVLLVDDLADTGHTLNAVIHQLRNNYAAHHRAAQRRHLDQGRVDLPAGLLGGVFAHQPLDSPAFRRLRRLRPAQLMEKWKRLSPHDRALRVALCRPRGRCPCRAPRARGTAPDVTSPYVGRRSRQPAGRQSGARGPCSGGSLQGSFLSPSIISRHAAACWLVRSRIESGMACLPIGT